MLDEHPFVAKARGLAQEKTISLEFAFGEIAQTDAALYDDYRQKLGLGKTSGS